jgi:hypothetical protein
MNAHFRRENARALRITRQEIADLLKRYPHVSDEEANLVVAFLRKGRHLDVGILTGDDKLKPHLDRFMADHSRHFRLSIGEATGATAAILAVLGFCWFIWELIKPATLTV